MGKNNNLIEKDINELKYDDRRYMLEKQYIYAKKDANTQLEITAIEERYQKALEALDKEFGREDDGMEF